MTKKEKKKYNKRRRFLRLMEKIYSLLELDEYKIIFSRMEERGWVIFTEKLILLDPRDEIFVTLIHECLHILAFKKKIIVNLSDDKKHEKEIEKLENFCAKHLDQEQAMRLTTLLHKNLIRSSKKNLKKF